MNNIIRYGERYCNNIFQHMVIFDNIVTIYDNIIVTQYGENRSYYDNIVEYFHNNNWHNNNDNHISKC